MSNQNLKKKFATISKFAAKNNNLTSAILKKTSRQQSNVPTKELKTISKLFAISLLAMSILIVISNLISNSLSSISLSDEIAPIGISLMSNYEFLAIAAFNGLINFLIKISILGFILTAAVMPARIYDHPKESTHA